MVYVFLKDRGDTVAEVPACFWPLVIVLGGPALLGRWVMERYQKQAKLQKELDEARRKKDEQDAADAQKTGYR
jgi:uncharacterized membrane protein (DUF106 family)